ncbi:hypothetical protein D3C75_843090 [compost metagenome]
MRINLCLQRFQLRLLFLDALHIHAVDQLLDIGSHYIERIRDLHEFIIAGEADTLLEVPFLKGTHQPHDPAHLASGQPGHHIPDHRHHQKA